MQGWGGLATAGAELSDTALVALPPRLFGGRDKLGLPASDAGGLSSRSIGRSGSEGVLSTVGKGAARPVTVGGSPKNYNLIHLVTD